MSGEEKKVVVMLVGFGLAFILLGSALKNFLNMSAAGIPVSLSSIAIFTFAVLYFVWVINKWINGGKQ